MQYEVLHCCWTLQTCSHYGLLFWSCASNPCILWFWLLIRLAIRKIKLIPPCEMEIPAWLKCINLKSKTLFLLLCF